MKITKSQLKQIIKEELNESTNRTGRAPYYADKIPVALSQQGVQLSDIVKGLAALAPVDPKNRYQPVGEPVKPDDVIEALVDLLVKKHSEWYDNPSW